MIFILNLIFFKMKQCQAQTLEDVTVYLDAPVFFHGQLYVALSRTVDPSNLHVAVKPDVSHATNVVYKEVLYRTTNAITTNIL